MADDETPTTHGKTIVFNCAGCGKSLSIGEVAAGMEIPCPLCNAKVVVPNLIAASIDIPASSDPPPSPRVAQPAAPPPPPAATQAKSLTTNQYLEYLSKNSSCKGLRWSVDATFWLNLILFVIAGLFVFSELATLESKYEKNAWRDARKQFLLYEMMAIWFAINGLIILKQFVMAIINAVDSIVLRNRDETRRENS